MEGKGNRVTPAAAPAVTWFGPDTLKPLLVDIRSLKPYQRNPRNGDLEAIEESLKINGQYRPIVVRKPQMEILAGNHTYMAALALEWTHIAVTFVECTDEQAARIVLVDNRTNDLAKYDDGLLVALLTDLKVDAGTLSGSGYSQRDYDKLLARTNHVEDEKPEVEFSPMLWEETNYVVLYFKNSIDWQAALETLGIKSAKCWDSKPGYERTGLGRVIDGGPIIRKLNGGKDAADK